MSAVVGSEFAGRSCVRFEGGAGMTKPSLSRCGCGWGGMAGEAGGGRGGEGGVGCEGAIIPLRVASRVSSTR